MNKRGQLYLLAAIIMCLAIYGIVKVQNKIEVPYDPEFSFFIDNFKGERTQVINLGIISGQEEIDDMSTLFAEFGWNTGIILIKPENGGYRVYNFRDDDITICTTNCEIETGELSTIGELNFNFGAGKTIKITDVEGKDIDLGEEGYYVPLSTFKISVEGNIFEFDNPGYKTIIFKDIDENFKKVEIV